MGTNSLDVFHSRISKKLVKAIGNKAVRNEQAHIFHNSVIESDECNGDYISEMANELFDDSESIVPLTSEIELISHVSKID